MTELADWPLEPPATEVVTHCPDRHEMARRVLAEVAFLPDGEALDVRVVADASRRDYRVCFSRSRRGLLDADAPLSLRANPLTRSEVAILRYLPTHLTLPMIADARFVSRHTVKSQVASIYRKLGVTSRQEAVETARTLGLLPRSAVTDGRAAVPG